MDLSFYKKHGYQVLKSLFSKEDIDTIRNFLIKEKDNTLNLIGKAIPFKDTSGLITKIQEYYEDEKAFEALDPSIKSMLCGHFSLEARLSPILHLVPKTKGVQEIFRSIIPNQKPRMHLPPTARFVLPGNYFAGVPPHQDVSYNKHVDDFFVIWVPFCKIDDQCGGVKVHKGTGNLPEQLTSYEKKFWLQAVPETGAEKIHCTMDVGDALLINKWIVHESALNTSDHIRYSSDFRFFCGPSSKHYLDMETWQTVAPVS